MGKGEERNGTTAQAGESTFLAKSSSEASKMLEAALLQMDDIISGTIEIFEYINCRYWCDFDRYFLRYNIIFLLNVIKKTKTFMLLIYLFPKVILID